MDLEPKDLVRFWSKVEKTNTCWEWKAYKSKTGYGQFWFRSMMHWAHRISYTISKGDIPIGLQLDHLCRNHSCVNPEHLEAVTLIENIQRSPIMGFNKTHCKRGHELNGDNIIRNSKGHRRCKICEKIRYDKSNLSNKEFLETYLRRMSKRRNLV